LSLRNRGLFQISRGTLARAIVAVKGVKVAVISMNAASTSEAIPRP
jgi:hypothetical protein